MSRADDCHVASKATIPEVGPRGTREITELRGWLLARDPLLRRAPAHGWRFRLATSIITQSEAGLFGPPLPRFAARVYLDANSAGLVPEVDQNAYFINARRTLVLCARAREWGRRQPYAQHVSGISEGPKRGLSPVWLLRRSSCIADSFLPPQAAPVGYHVLTTPIGGLYFEGVESDAVRAEVQGIPYVRHMALSGGLCAQAVCFMASVLLRQYATGIHGLAETTRLAGVGTADELPMVGLTQRQMVQFFRSHEVGLNAEWQALSGPHLEQRTWFRCALQSYLLSGMPVVYPLDQGRMVGSSTQACPLTTAESVYQINRIPVVTHYGAHSPCVRRNHAVLLVGCDKRDGILFNDTAAFPLMRASIAQLQEAGPYGDDTCTQLAQPVFLPVVPSSAHVPLLDWYSDSVADREPGLLKVALRLQSGTAGAMAPPYVFPLPYDPGELRLVTAAGAPLCPMVPETARSAVAACLQTLGACASSWFWLQYSGESRRHGRVEPTIWLWDANRGAPTAEALAPEGAIKYLVAVLGQGDGRWSPVWTHRGGGANEPLVASTPAPPVGPQVGRPTIARPQLALLSSFTLRGGLRSALALWPDAETACELYTFLESDAAKYLPLPFHVRLREMLAFLRYGLATSMRDIWARARSGRAPSGIAWPTMPAALRMAALGNDIAAQDRVGEAIHKEFERTAVRIAAFTTHLPQLTLSARVADEALLALRFLIGVAQCLKGHGHPVNVIEITAGSLVDGVWLGSDAQRSPRRQPLLVANLQPRGLVLHRLLDQVRLLAPSLEKVGVSLSVRLEPGVLSAVNDWHSLVELCDIMDSDTALPPCVGLTLDVAAWSMAGVRPEQVLGGTGGDRAVQVRRRIVHAVISDYGTAHLGDLPVASTHPPQSFIPWLQVLDRVFAEGHQRGRAGAPSFRGCLTIGTEGCGDTLAVTKSVYATRQLMAYVGQASQHKEMP